MRRAKRRDTSGGPPATNGLMNTDSQQHKRPAEDALPASSEELVSAYVGFDTVIANMHQRNEVFDLAIKRLCTAKTVIDNKERQLVEQHEQHLQFMSGAQAASQRLTSEIEALNGLLLREREARTIKGRAFSSRPPSARSRLDT